MLNVKLLASKDDHEFEIAMEREATPVVDESLSKSNDLVVEVRSGMLLKTLHH